MKNGTSRRDFVKAAMAASLAGVSASANAEEIGLNPAAEKHKRGASSHPIESSGEIEFPRVYTGRQLARISCPLGGIGTGGIGLGGRGNLQDWQIFNRPDTGNTPELTFPSLWVQTAGAAPYSVVLERRYLPPFDLGENGFRSGEVPGLPRLAEAKFFGSFPLSRIEFIDSACPVAVSLEAFSPFQPLDAEVSGLPCAVLSYQIHNPRMEAAEVAVAWSASNPVGRAKTRKNDHRKASGLEGIYMSDPSLDASDSLKGSFALAALTAPGGSIELLPEWNGGNIWSVGSQHFWFDNFAKTGHLGEFQEPSMPVGSVAVRQTIPAGATRSFRFLLAWHFANRTAARCGWEAPKGQENALLGNHYCTQFKDAWAAAEYAAAHLPELERGTREFSSALERSTLPNAVKDAASANLSTLVSNTSFRIADGSFHGFEGCGDKGGLGFGTCSHVWNYEVATQFVFPTLARSMRETNFGYATDADGHMDFRHKLPLGFEHWGAAAADGQMGQIVKLYMDWTMSGDNEWLRRQWPAAKRALAYAWRPGGWDERKSGVMDGVQHNTNDVEFYGPNSMCSTWYLAALRATARMAEAMGDGETARECERMCEQGSRWIDANLFNGEFYVQQIRGIPPDKIASGLIEGMGAKDTLHPVFQLGDCCFADQLIGQNMATVAGLGDLLDPEHIRIALKSIWQYNRRQDLAHYASVQRVYALNDEAAIINCDYRKGTRPEVPMPYYSENWTGLEHSLAALMISHGMVAEGVEIIENVRRRYDGEKANPYDESEYGRHYARAMASWAAVPMLSGFQFNARSGRMELAPRVSERDFRCFWSAASGWGSFELGAQGLSLEVVAGSVSLKELMLAPFAAGANLRVTSGELEVEHRASAEGSGVVVRFPKAVTVDAKQPLRVRTV